LQKDAGRHLKSSRVLLKEHFYWASQDASRLAAAQQKQQLAAVWQQPGKQISSTNDFSTMYDNRCRKEQPQKSTPNESHSESFLYPICAWYNQKLMRPREAPPNLID